MHGEYKVPGGKLVIADVETSQEAQGTPGSLAQVRISGDFFLEPDDALETINGALQGLPATSSVETMAGVLARALGEDVVMGGFSPEAVAIAVRRALGHATGWADHTFEVIRGEAELPFMQMALDEVLAQEVGAGTRPPTLRFWEWERNVVVIGSFQSMRNEVDPDGVARHDITVTRRVSGGGAMFIQPGNTITYSLYVPASLVEGLSFEQSYAFLDDWVLGALKELGIQARYVPLNDITSPSGKIAGAAQKRYATGAVLHHVTMSYDIDADAMLDVLRIGREKLSDKGTRSANKRVDPLRSQTGMSREAIIDSFAAHFASRYDTVPGEIRPAERRRAEELVESKFATPAWLTRVP
ncbi:lipoate--protein ligase family protein [Serinibacter salmoneus]|uniref:Lipoate-protein ligase A n=1 Tax=Serinibacter salmoneus TaxID=556530 RepID=A0A2A9D2Y5_9MICO|nr:biotin/lipoate A/B protein ligase family protein [Serinibacter salmoneus]PFG20209.1 lipoate-protein ligase A [Serinibacter salmoneus]